MRIKSLDLLRIFALSIIVVYHADNEALPGGFLGVEIFFVLTGYFFVQHFLRVSTIDGKSFVEYWLRRIYRLFPALCFAIVIVLIISTFLPVDYWIGLTTQILAALGFTTNIYEMLYGSGYEARFTPHLLTPTWYLGVLVQVTLLLSVVILIVDFCFRRSGNFRRIVANIDNTSHGNSLPYDYAYQRKRALLFGSLLVALLLVSVYYNWYGVAHSADMSYLYYSPFAHAYSICMGGIVGIAIYLAELEWQHNNAQHESTTTSSTTALSAQHSHFLLPRSIQYCGIGIIIAIYCVLARTITFEENQIITIFSLFGAAILTCVVIVLCYQANAGKKVAVQDLRHRIHREKKTLLDRIAALTYPFYLLHFPLLVLFAAIMPASLLGICLALLLCCVLSYLALYVWEPLWHILTPLRTDKLRRTKFVTPTGLINLVLIIIALVVPSSILSMRAPAMTALEQAFWSNNLANDADAVTNLVRSKAPNAVREQKMLNKSIPDQQTKSDKSHADRNASAKKDAIPYNQVSIIGDSVTVGARNTLSAMMPGVHIYAEGSRRMEHATAVMDQLASQHQLTPVVVVCIGTNSFGDYEKRFEEFIQHLPKGSRVLFMTPHDGHATPAWNSALLGEYERKRVPQIPFAALSDWDAIAKQHSDLYAGTDGTHFAGRTQLEQLYGQAIIDGLQRLASQQPKA